MSSCEVVEISSLLKGNIDRCVAIVHRERETAIVIANHAAVACIAAINNAF